MESSSQNIWDTTFEASLIAIAIAAVLYFGWKLWGVFSSVGSDIDEEEELLDAAQARAPYAAKELIRRGKARPEQFPWLNE
jgi:hypothetical protein